MLDGTLLRLLGGSLERFSRSKWEQTNVLKGFQRIYGFISVLSYWLESWALPWKDFRVSCQDCLSVGLERCNIVLVATILCYGKRSEGFPRSFGFQIDGNTVNKFRVHMKLFG